MWLIEDKNNEEITDKQGILNTWQKYVEELYGTRNQPAIMDIENETDISEDECSIIRKTLKGTKQTNKYGRRTERHLPTTDECVVRPAGERR